MTRLGQVLLICGVVATFVAGAAAAEAPAVASSCPQKQPVARSGPAAAHLLVPPSASQVLLCRYHFSRLQGHGLITRAPAIAGLTREFNRLRPMPPGTYSCPADFGVFVTARFNYRTASADTVSVDETGCTQVTNGRLGRWAFFAPGRTLLRQLLTDTGCAPGRRSPACA